jgi:hypothetical protein|uniref:Uncharacterized protein n=1 Tax=Mesoaciditoga lauensis TaxID=1495039 RepID=A0A7V3VSW5_9BACT
MSRDEYRYYSHSPDEWEKIDTQKGQKKPKKKVNKTGLILGINLAIILAILLFYFEFKGNPTVRNNSLQTVGDFQIYISASKDTFLSGSPLDFTVYLTNLSNSQKNFTIDSFSVRITSESTYSTPVYLFNLSKVIRSSVGPKGSILLYDLKHEVDLSNMKAGKYDAKILMNFDGKIVVIEKSFTYISNIESFLQSQDDFFEEGEKGKFLLYVQNNTASSLSLTVKNVEFKIFDQKMDQLYSKSIGINSKIDIIPGQQAFIYDYETDPLTSPGDYYITSEINGSTTLDSTYAFSVVNPKMVDGISNIKVISDIPLYVSTNVPFDFSVSLVNNDVFRKKYAVLNSLTIIVKKGNIELYRFTDDKTHNFIIQPGGTRLLMDSKNWHQLTFPSSGTYTFEVIAKIGNDFIKYDKKIESS